jgi:transposase
MKKSTKFSPEVRERAVRLVFECRHEHPSQWAAVESIASKIGCTPQTLPEWVRRHERDTGQRDGLTSAEQQGIKELERDVKKLRKVNEILKLASALFAQAELDRRPKSRGPSSTRIGSASGSSRSARSCKSPRRATGAMLHSSATPHCMLSTNRVVRFCSKSIVRFLGARRRRFGRCLPRYPCPTVAPRSYAAVL